MSYKSALIGIAVVGISFVGREDEPDVIQKIELDVYSSQKNKINVYSSKKIELDVYSSQKNKIKI